MKFFVWSVTALGLLAGCHSKPTTVDLATAKAEMLAADRAFSNTSAQKGMRAAFADFAHLEAVLLRPNTMPVVGLASVQQFNATWPDSTHTLTWQPLGGRVASSGDFGQTYGTYLLQPRDTTLPAQQGNYLTVWQKNQQGQWQWVGDTGNQGLPLAQAKTDPAAPEPTTLKRGKFAPAAPAAAPGPLVRR
jgi:ketosteroid isomerase-like protein